MANIPRHKVFVSFHHEDERYKDVFCRHMGGDIVDKSVEDGDIDPYTKTDTIRQKIRDEFIADASVTVVLVGPRTWQRKHVDWEIGSSLRKTQYNPRCGLLGILLPNHPDYGRRSYNDRLIPPRLADNFAGEMPFAHLYEWPKPWKTGIVRGWIHKAFERRLKTPYPNNSRPQFKLNFAGPSWGWIH